MAARDHVRRSVDTFLGRISGCLNKESSYNFKVRVLNECFQIFRPLVASNSLVAEQLRESGALKEWRSILQKPLVLCSAEEVNELREELGDAYWKAMLREYTRPDDDTEDFRLALGLADTVRAILYGIRLESPRSSDICEDD